MNTQIACKCKYIDKKLIKLVLTHSLVCMHKNDKNCVNRPKENNFKS